MYQALLATGDREHAQVIRKQIPSDDPHVRLLIKEYQKTYADSVQKGNNKGKKSTGVKKDRKTHTNSIKVKGKEGVGTKEDQKTHPISTQAKREKGGEIRELIQITMREVKNKNKNKK